MNANWSRLGSGSWGVRIWDGPPLHTGEQIEVTNRAGKTQTVTLGTRRGCHGKVQLFEVERQLKLEENAKPPAVTEPGVYESDEGILIVKWNRDKTGLYAKKLVEINAERLNEEGDRVQIEFEYAPGAVFRLTPDQRMPVERAKALCIRYGRCINCGRGLRAAESVERGIGPVCIKSFGPLVRAA